MNLELLRDPWKNDLYYFTTDNEVDWKGTPGVGDVLFGLNIIHMLHHLSKKKRTVDKSIINIYWNHSKDHLHHFEDPETIVERADYLHKFYHDYESVIVNHIFDSNDKEIEMLRHRGFQRVQSPVTVIDGMSSWMFRRDVWCDNPVPNKVVFWRPLFNAEIPRGWKRTFSASDWDKILDILDSKGFDLIELTYRSPVREAFYHIKTSRFCIFYDGMWQYIAKNMCKPVISLGDNSITRIHSPQGVFFYKPKPDDSGSSLFTYLEQMPRVLAHMDRRASRYRKFILGELNVADRPRGN